MDREREIVPQQSTVEEALTYAQRGWPVFPVAGKIPFKGTHGHRDATTDELIIRSMWQEHPGANIGLATGIISGVIVLDLDPRHNGFDSLKMLEATYEPLPQTKTARTPHNGLHLYFLHPQDNVYPNTQSVLGEGLDTRGDGGYVVLPPSTLYGRARYTWGKVEEIAPLPDWLHSVLPQKGKKDSVTPQRGSFALRPGEQWISQALANAQEGNRNQIGFSLALQLRDDGLTEEEAKSLLISYALHVPKAAEPYTVKEALATVKSAYSRPPRSRAQHQ